MLLEGNRIDTMTSQGWKPVTEAMNKRDGKQNKKLSDVSWNKRTTEMIRANYLEEFFGKYSGRYD